LRRAVSPCANIPETTPRCTITVEGGEVYRMMKGTMTRSKGLPASVRVAKARNLAQQQEGAA